MTKSPPPKSASLATENECWWDKEAVIHLISLRLEEASFYGWIIKNVASKQILECYWFRDKGKKGLCRGWEMKMLV